LWWWYFVHLYAFTARKAVDLTRQFFEELITFAAKIDTFTMMAKKAHQMLALHGLSRSSFYILAID